MVEPRIWVLVEQAQKQALASMLALSQGDTDTIESGWAYQNMAGHDSTPGSNAMIMYMYILMSLLLLKQVMKNSAMCSFNSSTAVQIPNCCIRMVNCG
jgi:hypothetical protein